MSIRRAAAWMMASQYASFAIQFLSSVVISRFFLLPADVGLFSIALAAAMVVAIFQDMGISRFVTGQPHMREEHVRDYAAVAVGIGWLVAGAVALAAWPLSQAYDQPGLTGLVLIIALSYLAIPFAIVPAALITRAMNFRLLFFANAGSALAGAVVAIGSAAAGSGPSSLAWGMLATAVTRTAVVLAARPVLPALRYDSAVSRPLLHFGGSAFVLSLSGAIGMRSQDLIVGRILGVTATGLFTRATALAGQLSTLTVGAINAVFYPAFAKKRDEGADLAAPYLHLIACNTALTWAAMAGLALAAEPLVAILYGPNWAEVAPLMRWTALAEACFFAVPLQMDIPILLGRIKQLVWINLLDTAATVAILAVFAFWGLEEAAISRLVAAALWFALYITYISRLVGLGARSLARIYLSSAVCAIAAGLPLALALHFEWFGASMNLAALLAMSLCGGACWLAALIATGHPAWGEVRGILQRFVPARLATRGG